MLIAARNLLTCRYRPRAGSTKDKRASVGQPFISARLDAGVDFYFLAFLAFFFFTIVSSFCSDIGKSKVCLKPINVPNSFNSKSRDLFHAMVNKIEVLNWPTHGLSSMTANERGGPLESLLANLNEHPDHTLDADRSILRLITNSNLVGCHTGRSAGLLAFAVWLLTQLVRMGLLSIPNRFRYLDNPSKLGFLLGYRQRIAKEVTAKAALWRQADLIKRDVFLGVIESPF